MAGRTLVANRQLAGSACDKRRRGRPLNHVVSRQNVPESAFIVRVPEAEASVSALRQRCDPSAVLGVPAHVTILVPFMSADRITSRILDAAAEAVGAVQAFSFTLGQVSRWPETTYLLPEPVEPFVRLTNALVGAFPDYSPYGGRHAQTVPHLTVADRSAERADEAEGTLRAILADHGPITSACHTVELIENSTGVWRFMHAMSLRDNDG